MWSFHTAISHITGGFMSTGIHWFDLLLQRDWACKSLRLFNHSNTLWCDRINHWLLTKCSRKVTVPTSTTAFFLFHCRNELPKQREVLVPSMPNTRQGSQKMRQACNKPYFVRLQAALTEMQIMSVTFNHSRVTYDKSKGLLYPQIHSKRITETLVTQLFSAYFIISNTLL